MLLLIVGGILIGLLAVAAMIEPDERGYGTHQRLGLPPCTFQFVTGVRCPSCGMTTSWAYLVRGQLIKSLKSNTGGTLVGVIAMLLAPWALLSGLRGRWFWKSFNDWAALIVTLAVILVTLVDWSVRFFVRS
jgi:hypothetical protein